MSDQPLPPFRFVLRDSSITETDAREITGWCSVQYGERNIGRLWEHDYGYGGYSWWIATTEDAVLFRLQWSHYDWAIA